MVGALNVSPRIGTDYHRYLKKWIRVLLVHFCSNCVCTLYLCTVESLEGYSPWCDLNDKWVIISSEFFSFCEQ